MTIEVILLLVIVAAALVLFVSGRLRVDGVGLLVLPALALTGLVSPQEALAGFSSPAVVTVWAMFILSAGLTRTGIAQRLGQPLQRFTKRSEALLLAVLMAAASLLSPRTTLAGRTLAELLFRDHFGLSVLAIWRKGRAYRTGLQDIPLQFGDALLVYGQRRNLEALARDPNFLVLDEAAAQAPRLEKAFVAAAVMAAVLLSAILGVCVWLLPILWPP